MKNLVKVFAVFLLVFIPSTYLYASTLAIESENTIVDSSGRRYTVKKTFERIISLYAGHTENLFCLGLDKEIIGISEQDSSMSKGVKKKIFSYHDDPEKFLAERPDLVLVRPMIDRGYYNFIAKLEKSGIIVLSLQPVTIDEMYTYWSVLGIITGKKNEADDMITRFHKVIYNIKTLTSNIKTKRKVYFEAVHGKMKTFSQEAMAIFALKTAGGVNIAENAIPVKNTNIAYFGKEQILSLADEIDVYLAQYGAMNRPTVEMIKKEPGFKVIKAVKNNEIYIIDETIVSRPTFKLLNGIYEIGKILYPNVFNNLASEVLKAGGCH